VIEDSFEKVHSALLCLAVGAESKEEVEEYVPSNDGLALKSKKISTKKLPPDLSAIKIILALPSDKYDNMSEEELEKEKTRLLSLLNQNSISPQKKD